MQPPAAEFGLLQMPDDVIVTIVRMTKPPRRRTLLILELANTCRRFMRMFPLLALCLFKMPTIGELSTLVSEHYFHVRAMPAMQKRLTRLICRYVKGARVIVYSEYLWWDDHDGPSFLGDGPTHPGRGHAERVCISDAPKPLGTPESHYRSYLATMSIQTARYLRAVHGERPAWSCKCRTTNPDD